VARRIAKNTEQIFSSNISCFMAQIIEVDKEVKHKIFVHDVVPVFRFNIGKNSRAKTTVERNNFVKLFKAGPGDVLSPTRIRLVESFGGNKPGRHLELPFYRSLADNSCVVALPEKFILIPGLD